MRRAVSLVAFLALLALMAGTALASLPDPLNSTFSDWLGRSPKNDTRPPAYQFTYMGILRDNTGAPVPNFDRLSVELEILGPCPNPVTLNPDSNSGPGGEVEWGATTLTQGGGACANGTVAIVRVLGVPVEEFHTLALVRSPDVDGDGLVALNDFQAFQVSFTTQTSPHIGDLDGDGVIGLPDLVFFQNHFAP